MKSIYVIETLFGFAVSYKIETSALFYTIFFETLTDAVNYATEEANKQQPVPEVTVLTSHYKWT